MSYHKPLHVLAILGAGLLSSAPARADSMSCRNRIASTGDSLYEVRSVCGEPDEANRRVEYRTIRIRGACWGDGERRVCERDIEHTIEVIVDEWTYDFGRNRFVRYLTFEQGHLLRIDSGSYGHKPAQ